MSADTEEHQEKQQAEQSSALPQREDPPADDRDSGSDDKPNDRPASRTEDADTFISAAERSLPQHLVEAYYGLSESTFSGPTAFGAHSTVIGAVNHFAASRPRELFHTESLPGTELRDVCSVYLRTDTDDLLHDRLVQRRVIYLSGQPGTGRWTTAAVALAERHAPDHVAYIHLAPDTRLADIVADPRLLRERHGHILLPDDDSSLSMPLLTTLEAHAERCQATVVVIGQAGDTDAELSRYLVPHVSPNPLEVFTAWLTHQLHEDGNCIEQCDACHGECIERYVRCCRDDLGERLMAIHPVRVAVHTAGKFAQFHPRGTDAERFLPNGRVGLRTQAEDLLRPKLLGTGYRGYRAKLHQQAFRLAYAVLDGYPLTRVFHATGVLIDQLDDALQRPRAGRSILEFDLDTLLSDDVRAESATPAGDDLVGVARMARLRHPRLADALLDVAWNDYDSARGPLLEWIRALVDSGDGWVPAAAVAGRLCAYDYDHVHGELITRWARSARPLERQAAALACESAAYNEHLTARILRSVRGWVSGPSAYLHDSATRVYATRLFARRFPEYALADLRVIALDDMQRRTDSVPWTVQRIYCDNTAADVIAMIMDWATSDLPHLRGLADRCLVTLANQGAEETSGRWPLLLGHARDGLIQLSDLAQLWPSALRQPMTSHQAWTALQYWISYTEGEPEIRTVLQDLLAPVLHDPPLRIRARFYLNQVWRKHMPDNPFIDVLGTLLEG